MYFGNKITSVKAADLLKVLVAVVAAFFVLSIANIAGAGTFSITGKVVAIDTYKKTITIDGSYAYAPTRTDYGDASGLRTFALDQRAYVMMGNEKRHFSDIKVGDWVTVSFHQESNGLVVADGIAFTSPPAPYAAAGGQMYSITGKIVAIDRDADTFTLVPSYYYGTNYGGERVFAFDRGAWIMMGDDRREFRDLRVGDWVTVNFREEAGGPAMAEGIAITYPPAPYPEARAQMFSFTGKVIALDRDARTLSVYPSCYEPSSRRPRIARVFVIGHDTTVMLGNESRDLRDIRVGDVVTVNYHQQGNGLVVTDGVAITFPATSLCPEERG